MGTTTDENGFYSFKNIPKGRYEMVISMIGYKMDKVNVNLFEEDRLKMNFRLIPEPIKMREIEVSSKSNKEYFFSLEDRVSIVNKSLFKDLKLNKKKILIKSFNTLTIDLCKKYKASIIIRGLRAVSDFEYEFQLAGMNKKLNNDIETIFLMSNIENQIISSNFVKEIAKLNGNVNKFLTKSAVKILKDKLKWEK